MFTANLAGSSHGGAPHYLHHHHLRPGDHHQTGGSHTRLNYLPPHHRDRDRESLDSRGSGASGGDRQQGSVFAQGGMFNRYDDSDAEDGGNNGLSPAAEDRMSANGESRNASIGSHQLHAVHPGKDY